MIEKTETIRMLDDELWSSIAGRSRERGRFFNKKFLIKEDTNMVAEYKEFLAELQNELSELENVSIDAAVEQRMAEIREQIVAEETKKKNDAIAEKQLEIKATENIIARLEVATLEVVENENVEGE